MKQILKTKRNQIRQMCILSCNRGETLSLTKVEQFCRPNEVGVL